MDAVRLVILAGAVLALASCGSSESAKTASGTQTSTTPTEAPKPAEPTRKLSPEEYDDVHASFEMLKPLTKAQDDPKRMIAIVRPACSRLRIGTGLVVAMRAQCVQAVRLLGAVRRLERETPLCTRHAQAGDVSCFANAFRLIGRSARVEMVREAAMDRELRRRHIRGACARSIGTSARDRETSASLTHDSLAAARALEARDEAGFQRAAARLTEHLDTPVDADVVEKALRDLKACR